MGWCTTAPVQIERDVAQPYRIASNILPASLHSASGTLPGESCSLSSVKFPPQSTFRERSMLFIYTALRINRSYGLLHAPPSLSLSVMAVRLQGLGHFCFRR